MKQNKMSNATLKRLPTYLNYLKTLDPREKETISSSAIATALDMGEVQVRKDLASVCSSGKPKVGYRIVDLIQALEEYLGYNKIKNVVLVGAGSLGSALLCYDGFAKYGVNIAAGFDFGVSSPVTIKNTSKTVYPMNHFKSFCSENHIKIGVITVPGDQAQSVCDMMVEAGFLAIWNFAPVHLDVPPHILVTNENMAYSLVILSNHISD